MKYVCILVRLTCRFSVLHPSRHCYRGMAGECKADEMNIPLSVIICLVVLLIAVYLSTRRETINTAPNLGHAMDRQRKREARETRVIEGKNGIKQAVKPDGSRVLIGDYGNKTYVWQIGTDGYAKRKPAFEGSRDDAEKFMQGLL